MKKNNVEHKLLRVTLEFTDEVRTLEGKDALKWQEAVDEQGTLSFCHGQKFPLLNWKVKNVK